MAYFKIVSVPSLLCTIIVGSWNTPSLRSQRNLLTQVQENAESLVWGNSVFSSLMSHCFRNAVRQSGLETVLNGEVYVLTKAAAGLSSLHAHLVTCLHQVLRDTEPVYPLRGGRNCLLRGPHQNRLLENWAPLCLWAELHLAREHQKCFIYFPGGSSFQNVKNFCLSITENSPHLFDSEIQSLPMNFFLSIFTC